MNRFDRKFGADLLRELPESSAVYLFKDEAGQVLYTGKAKNIRRRLSSYRNANRRKAQRKMRTLVREAHSLEVRLQPSEREALLVENELIRAHRPPYNVDGAFDFLYPAIGTGHSAHQLRLCFTTQPEAFSELDLRWHGVFRPRVRARDAFESLVGLLTRVGHLEPRSQLPRVPRLRGSRVVALRRVPPELLGLIRDFLDGDSDALLGELFRHLLESRPARREAGQVQEALRIIEDFYHRDALHLREARQATGRGSSFVPQAERDALFIQARMTLTDGGQDPPAHTPRDIEP